MNAHSTLVMVEKADLDETGVLSVRGWAAGPASVEAVEVIVAGVRLGEAEYGLGRPDVLVDHPDFPDAAHSGFAFRATLEPSQRAAPQAFVLVRAAGLPAQAAALPIVSTQAEAAGPDDALQFHCDTLALYDDGAVEIAGWAAHLNEITRMEVALDADALGEAAFGRLRPDVGKSLPDIPSATRSGFEFGATLDALGAGEHDIALTFFTKSGDRFTRKLKASTQVARGSGHAGGRQDIRAFIDSPEVQDGAFVEPVRRLLAIEGWAIARRGVAAIEAYLDGALVSVASRGVRRLDIGAQHPDWPDALMSGYAIILPRKVFSRDKHQLRIDVRDRRGETKSLEVAVTLAPPESEEDGGQLRRVVPQAEIDLKLALLEAAPPRPAFAVVIAPGEGLARTLDSLAAQAWPHFRAGVVGDPAPEIQAAARAAGLELRALEPAFTFAEAIEALLPEAQNRPFGLWLRAGDRLGADALMEFALDIATRPEEDFHYADDRRFDATAGRVAEWLKPEWSPDLLLSTAYIGRAWCAALELARRAGPTLGATLAAGDYDLALRLTEAAHEIGRAPLLLMENGAAADTARQEKTALQAAMGRRGIAGGVRATAAPGVWRLRRRVKTKALVSIIIPTIARGGFVEKCLASLRAHTAYDRFEIVLVDNIADPDAREKAWMRRHADCVVEYPGPFNWSKLNNLGAEAALGDYLLFLNDDIEALEPRWLHAMMEHASRPEVGLVGPRLLYPDGRVQHAGLYLVEDSGRHAFRFAEADEKGPFGLAAAARNVAAVTGAAMLMRRDAYKEAGGFEEGHAVVNNDVDMCLRMWRAGLRVVYTPHATLTHHEMASRSELHDVFDKGAFESAWRQTFGLGDPFFHPRLSREEYDYAPDAEAARLIVAGRPLLKRESVQSILALKLDHVGDFLTGFPALRRLKKRFPAADIHVLAPTASLALAKLEPAIAGVIDFNFFHSVSQLGKREIEEEEWRALEARLKPYRFDIAIDLRKHVDTRETLKRSGAKILAGFDQRNAFPWLDVALEWDGDERFFPKRTQVADDYVALVEALSVACECERTFGPTTPPPRPLGLPASLFERPVVGVHPAAGSVLRQWPPEHFALLIDLLIDAFDVNVALIGTPSESSIAEATLAHVGARARVTSLLGRTSLADLPGLLGALTLFVGNNSGPHHIAAALGVPTVGIHSGVVSAREWGPLGPKAVAIQRDMSCGPCYLERPSGCARGLACLQGLRPSEVFRICEQMLGPALRRT